MCCSCFDLQQRQLFRDSAKWLCEMRGSKFSGRVLGSALAVLSEPPAPAGGVGLGRAVQEGRAAPAEVSCPAAVPMLAAAPAAGWLLRGHQRGPPSGQERWLHIRLSTFSISTQGGFPSPGELLSQRGRDGNEATGNLFWLLF